MGKIRMTVVMKAEFAQSYMAQARMAGVWRPSRPRIVRGPAGLPSATAFHRPQPIAHRRRRGHGPDGSETVTPSPSAPLYSRPAARPRTRPARRLPLRGIRGLDPAPDRPPERDRG